LFFQSEDGIRDATVTGVQTCALPISAQKSRRSCEHSVVLTPTQRHSVRRVKPMKTKTIKVDYLARVEGEGALYVKIKDNKVSDEIGRASCRERVEIREMCVVVKKREL